MHRKNPISVLVYNTLFPSPSPTDPPSFSAHLSKNLVGEVRIETANFYGSLDTIEARYPGLNYAFAPHRKRLGRFPHHRRLFEAFDRLGLTESEIQGFCRWEGTLWARERYERDEGVKVADTTGVEIGAWIDRRRQGRSNNAINVKTDIEVEIEEVPAGEPSRQDADTHMQDDEEEEEDEEEEGSSDEENANAEDLNAPEEEEELSSSVGFNLNAHLVHLRAQIEASAASNIALDSEWEQYFKDAQERGELSFEPTTSHEVLRSLTSQLTQLRAETSAAAAAQQQQPQQPQGIDRPAAPA